MKSHDEVMNKTCSFRNQHILLIAALSYFTTSRVSVVQQSMFSDYSLVQMNSWNTTTFY